MLKVIDVLEKYFGGPKYKQWQNSIVQSEKKLRAKGFSKVKF